MNSEAVHREPRLARGTESERRVAAARRPRARAPARVMRTLGRAQQSPMVARAPLRLAVAVKDALIITRGEDFVRPCRALGGVLVFMSRVVASRRERSPGEPTKPETPCVLPSSAPSSETPTSHQPTSRPACPGRVLTQGCRPFLPITCGGSPLVLPSPASQNFTGTTSNFARERTS